MPEVVVEGVAFWASRLPGWDIARAVIRGEQAAPETASAAAGAGVAGDRRSDVARRTPSRSRSKSPRAPAKRRTHRRRELPAVFASTHGDLAISDYMCATLVEHADADLADQVSQLGAQRRGRLLEHRHRQPRAVHRDQRVPSHVRRRAAGGGDAGRVRAAAGAVRRVRHRSERCAGHDGAEPRLARRGAGAGARRRGTSGSPASVNAHCADESMRARRRRARPAAALVADNALAPCLPLFEALALRCAPRLCSSATRSCCTCELRLIAGDARHDRQLRRGHPRRRPRRA